MTVILPHGSEDICYWCLKNYKCSYYKDNEEIEVIMYRYIPIKVRPRELRKLGSLQGCPINGFTPNSDKLIKTFKTIKYKLRS